MKKFRRIVSGLVLVVGAMLLVSATPTQTEAVNTVPAPISECLTTALGGYTVCYTLDNVTVTPTNVSYTYGTGGSQSYSISAHLKINRATTSPQVKNINFFGVYSAVQSGTNVTGIQSGYNSKCTPGVNDNWLACGNSGAAYGATGSDESWGSLNDAFTIHDNVIVSGGEYITFFADLRYSFTYTYSGTDYSTGQFATGPTITITAVKPQCSINSFTADNYTVNYNGSTNLRYTLSGSFPWSISTLSGSGSASPASGTSASGSSSSGALTSTTTYRLTCGSDYQDVTVSVPSAPVCSPANASGSPGTGINLSASGGDGSYAWSTPSSSTFCGNSASCTVNYSSPGSYSATVTSGGRSSTCNVSVSSLCGNGAVDPGEQCDGSNLNGQTCTSQGFTSGTLSCNSNCTFNTSACTSGGTQSISASKLSCTGSNATYNIHVVSTAYNFYIKLIDALGNTNIMTSMNEPVTTAAGRDYTTGAWVTNNMRFQLVKASDNSVLAETNVGNTGCSTGSTTCTISASPSSGTGSASGNLTWSSTNATSCTASGGWSGAKATSGTQSYGTIYSSTTYSLSCTNGTSTGSCSATVNVGASTPKYRCSGSSCIRDDIGGSYTTSNCNNTCTVVTPKYRCSGSSCIRDDIGGSYTTSNCNNTCSVATLSCAPSIQTVAPGQFANFSASGGTGAYSWFASGGNPSTGFNSFFSSSYFATGAYSVSVTSGSQTAYCMVNVQSGSGPSELSVSNFYLTDASGNVKNTFAPGENIYPAVTIANNSSNPTVSSQGYFYISLYSNAPGTVGQMTGSDVGVWVKETGSIPAWGTKTYSVLTNSAYWTNDTSNKGYWTMSNTGTYTARAYVDSFNYVTETNETNNQSAYSYTIGSLSLPPSVSIDLPAASATVSGNVQIAGWALDNTTRVETAISGVKIYVDGAYVGNATAYSRSDVCAAYPGRVGCPNVGYQFTWNSTSVANGTHTIRMEATDSDTAPKTAFVDRQVTVSNPPVANIKANGSDGPVTISYNQTASITWTSTNATSCTVSPGGWTGLSGSQTTPAITSSVTYTLTCTNGGQTGTDSVTINVPPPPTNPVGICPAPGSSLTASWTAAPGYTHHYFRAYDLANGWHNCTLTDICVDDLVATSYTFAAVPGHTYSWWVHTRDTATGAYSNAVGTNVSCAAAVCPSGAVTLSAATVNIGQSVIATPPSGWSGGSYNSSNSSVASVSGSSVTGVSAGSVQVSGFGWTANNGATNCSLSNANLTVNPPPRPTISLSPTTFSFSGISGGATPAAQTLTVRNTGTAALNWTSSGVPGKPGTWCHVSPASGSLAAGSQQNVSVSVDSPSNVGTFTDCGIRISDPNATNNPQDVSVTYTVTANMVPPTNLGGVNSGAGLSCGQIKVTWTDNAMGEAGFKVYRNTANNSASASLIATVPSTSSLTTGTNYSYTDTPPAYNVAYYYWVTAYVGSIESSRDSGATGSINNTSCEANLNTSDKDIASVNGVTNPTNVCQNNGEFPTNVQFKAGDVVGFNINLCNTAPASGGKNASTITIDDTLYNLARYDSSKALTDPAAWNASVTGGLSIASITPSGTEPDNLRLHIVLAGNIPAGSSVKLSFFAKVAFPTNFSGTSSRFQNAASITYVKDGGTTTATIPGKSTPLLLFIKSQAPTKIETSP